MRLTEATGIDYLTSCMLQRVSVAAPEVEDTPPRTGIFPLDGQPSYEAITARKHIRKQIEFQPSPQ